MRLKRAFLSLVLSLSLIFLVASGVQADHKTWIGAGEQWDNAGKWDPPGPPGPGDTAELAAGTQCSLYGSIITATTAGLTLDSGSALNVFPGYTVAFSGPATLANEGFLNLGAGSSEGGVLYSDYDLDLTGGGYVNLGGTLKGSGVITNHQLILGNVGGSGGIKAQMINVGTIRANSGGLPITSFIEQEYHGGFGTIEAQTGTRVELLQGSTIKGGWLNPNGGEIHLKGTILWDTTLLPGGHIIRDNPAYAVIREQCEIRDGAELVVFPACTLRLVNDVSTPNVVLLANLGIIRTAAPSVGYTPIQATDGALVRMGGNILELSGGALTETGGGQFINNYRHVIKGNGAIAAPLQNTGLLRPEGGTLRIDTPVTGFGEVEVADSGRLFLNQDLTTGNFTMEPTATWQVATDRWLNLYANFSFYQTNAATWQYGDKPNVRFFFTTYQIPRGKMEVGGRDYGLSDAGFTGNFNLGTLTVDNAGTDLTLVDEIDNGHRASPEALYTDTLNVLPGAILNLNGLHLYTKLQGVIHRVTAGEGQLFGGGLISDRSTAPVLLPLLLQ